MNAELKKWLPFVVSVLLSLVLALLLLWWFVPSENTLPTVYGVM